MFVIPNRVSDPAVVADCLKEKKPVPVLKIRDPDLLDFLPEEGREVPATDFWLRRLRDGDVIEYTPAAGAGNPKPTGDAP